MNQHNQGRPFPYFNTEAASEHLENKCTNLSNQTQDVNQTIYNFPHFTTNPFSPQFQSTFTKKTNSENDNDLNRDNSTGDSVKNISLALVEAIKNISKNFHHSANANNLPYIFHGFEHEDPLKFLDQLNNYFLENKIVDDYFKIDFTYTRLKDDAKKWLEPYIVLNLSFDNFCQRFLNKYNSSDVIAHATVKLYGEAQQSNEVVEVSKKCALFQRLMPNMPEANKAGIILNLLKPELRANLRVSYFENTEQLISVASKIENDLHQIPKTKNVVSPLNPHPNIHERYMTANNFTDNKRSPPTPCKYCRAMHFHKDCPQNPYTQGNAQRPAAGYRTSQQRPGNQH